MDDAVVPSIRNALPQAVVLAAAVAGFLWAAAVVRDRLRRGLPLVEPRPHPPVAWESGDVAVVVVVYLLGASLLAPAGTDPKPLFDRLADNVVLSLGTMLAAMSWLSWRGATWGSFGLAGGRGREDLQTACRGLALVVFPLLMLAAALNALVRYEHPIVDFLSGQRTAAAAALVILSAVVVAPLAEEFFFRRVLQGWLQTKEPPLERGAAVGLTAALFAVAHYGQGLAWLPLFALGLVLGWIVRRTGSLVPAILLHAMFNAVSVVLLLVQTRAAAAAG